MNWARIIMIAIILLACWVGWAWRQYRQLVHQLDEERALGEWTEDRL